MGFFGLFSYTSDTTVETASESKHVKFQSTTVVIPTDAVQSSSLKDPSSVQATQGTTLNITSTLTETAFESSVQKPVSVIKAESQEAKEVRRFSFRSFGFVRKESAEQKPTLSSLREQQRREHAIEASAKRAQKVQLSRSDKRAKKSALIVRSLIVGPTSASPQITPAVAKPQLNKIKSQLMETKSANKLITELRGLPAFEHPSTTHNSPIHAVCLEHTDEEEHNLYFAKLSSDASDDINTQAFSLPGIGTERLANIFKEVRVIDLVKAPDLGLGQPGNGDGLLAGAVPTAGTVIDGVKRITPELMALGYATSRAFLPDHSGNLNEYLLRSLVTQVDLLGIYPPTDRMSVLTCK